MPQLRPYSSNDERLQPSNIQEGFRQFRDYQFTRLVKSVVGNATVNLTTDDSRSSYIEFTGLLTGNINIVVTLAPWSWQIFNNTTGAFTITIKTLSGTGISVAQGKRAILTSDGTNVVRITPDT